jgi:Ca2+-binding EF-hand superfamily protein
MCKKLNKILSASVVALSISLLPSVVIASDMPERGPIPFASYDKNSDGFISEIEFNNVHTERMQERADSGRMMRNAGNAPEFSEFDANKDGKLTQTELETTQNAKMQERVKQGMGAGRN